MASLGLALKTAWKVLTDQATADRVREVFDGTAAPRIEAPSKPEPRPDPDPPAPAPPTPSQNPAVTLLAALQREARFVDFLQESLDGFPDAQVGAVAREVHRGCGEVIDRFFGITALLEESEGNAVSIPENADPARIRVTGQGASSGATEGKLQHHGWQATRCELPTWSGEPDTADIVAPAEVEAS